MWIMTSENVLVNADRILFIKFHEKEYKDTVDRRPAGTWAFTVRGYVYFSSTDTTKIIESGIKSGKNYIDLRGV